jgi:hypothetical protein
MKYYLIVPLKTGDNYVVFYYLTASEICPDKRGGLMALEQEWPVLRGTIT